MNTAIAIAIINLGLAALASINAITVLFYASPKGLRFWSAIGVLLLYVHLFFVTYVWFYEMRWMLPVTYSISWGLINMAWVSILGILMRIVVRGKERGHRT